MAHGPAAPPAAAVALALVVLAVAAAASAPPDPVASLTPEEQAWLRQHGPLRLVVGLEVPPTVFFDADGRAKGIALDLLNLLDVKLGVPYEVQRAPNFTAAIDLLRRGEGDLIGPITPDPAREAFLDYSPPFITGSLTFWVPESSPLEDPEQLAGKRVATVRQGASERWVRENRPDIVPVPVNDTLEGLRLASRGEVAAALHGIAVAAYHVQNGDVAGLRSLGRPVQLVDAGWAVPEGQPILLSILNKGMASIGPAERTGIFTKWTGYDLAPSQPDDGAPPPFALPQELQALLVAAAGLILLLALGTLLLRRQVAARTRELAEANGRLAKDLARREQAERELAASERQLRTVFEASPVGIVNVDLDGRILDANRAFGGLVGLAPAVLTGKSLVDLAAPEDRDELLAQLRALAGGRRERASLELRHLHREGHAVWGLLEAAPVRAPQGQVLHLVCLVTDLTERRRGEAERYAAQEREREVQRLKELDLVRTRFLGTTAHELNTPLTPILLQLQLLADAGQPLTPAQRRSLEVLQRNFERLRRLIQDLLQAARLQAGKLELRPAPVDLDRIVAEAVESFQEPARQAGITLRVEAGAGRPVLADGSRVTQVVYNLLSNAIKFTPAGGRITVRLAVEAQGVTVRVQDTGVGLRPGDLAQLFHPFAQLHTEDGTRREGTGLGLYLSRGIVELHGGRLWCESDGPGQGATFGFTLPAVPAAPRLEDVPPPQAASRPLPKP